MQRKILSYSWLTSRKQLKFINNNKPLGCLCSQLWPKIISKEKQRFKNDRNEINSLLVMKRLQSKKKK